MATVKETLDGLKEKNIKIRTLQAELGARTKEFEGELETVLRELGLNGSFTLYEAIEKAMSYSPIVKP